MAHCIINTSGFRLEPWIKEIYLSLMFISHQRLCPKAKLKSSCCVCFMKKAKSQVICLVLPFPLTSYFIIIRGIQNYFVHMAIMFIYSEKSQFNLVCQSYFCQK